MENHIETVQETLDITQQNNYVLENKLDTVQETLDVAIESVTEKRSIKDQNYLSILKLRKPFIHKRREYHYYAIRCTGIENLNSAKLNMSHERVVYQCGPNNATNAWKVIRDKLKKARKMIAYRNYFCILTKNGEPRIKEQNFAVTFKKRSQQ